MVRFTPKFLTALLGASLFLLPPNQGSRAGTSDVIGGGSDVPDAIRMLQDAQRMVQRHTPKRDDAVYGRLQAIAALEVRIQIEWYYRREPGPDVPRLEYEFSKHLNEWVAANDVRRHFSSGEAVLFDRPMGGWSTQQLSSWTYMSERLAILLWAFGEMKVLPSYDVPSEGLFLDPIGLLGSVKAMRHHAKLRSADELVRQLHIARVWVERGEMHRTAKQGALGYSDPSALAKVAALAKKAVDLGAIPTVYKGDFPTFGEPYRLVSDPNYVKTFWISSERLLALAWLLGRRNDWFEPSGSR